MSQIAKPVDYQMHHTLNVVEEQELSNDNVDAIILSFSCFTLLKGTYDKSHTIWLSLV